MTARSLQPASVKGAHLGMVVTWWFAGSDCLTPSPFSEEIMGAEVVEITDDVYTLAAEANARARGVRVRERAKRSGSLMGVVAAFVFLLIGMSLIVFRTKKGSV